MTAKVFFYFECLMFTLFQGSAWDVKAFDRSTDGLCAMLLSLRKSPLIRFHGFSDMARRLAANIRVTNDYNSTKYIQFMVLIHAWFYQNISRCQVE